MKKKLNGVLLVDDNESDNFFHKRVIEQAGITDFFGIALNGQEAIDFLTTSWTLGQKENADCQPYQQYFFRRRIVRTKQCA